MSNRYIYFVDFFSKIIQDETLLRLLHYPSSHSNDDVTLITADRPSIIGNNTPYKDTKKPLYNYILETNIRRAPKSSDLINTAICRICMYMGDNIKGNRNSSNKVFKQDVVFDIYTHIDGFETKDCRSLKICDRIDELIHENNITGIGKAESYKTFLIGNSPDGFIGYRMVFTFGVTK